MTHCDDKYGHVENRAYQSSKWGSRRWQSDDITYTNISAMTITIWKDIWFIYNQLSLKRTISTVGPHDGPSSQDVICYWPEFPRSRSTAAWTFPEVATRARMFSWVSKKPISWSCDNWVAYNCSGGSEKVKMSVEAYKIYSEEQDNSANHLICSEQLGYQPQVHQTCSSTSPTLSCSLLLPRKTFDSN